MDGVGIIRRGLGALGLRLGVLAFLFLATPSWAVTLSGISGVTLSATKASALTVSIPSGSSMNFTLIQGAIANGSVAAQISTAWSVNPGLTGSVRLYGYFSTPAAALTGATTNIASSYVEGQMATGAPTTFAAFTQTNPVGPAGGSLLLLSETITGVNKNKTRVDNLNLRINLSTSPAVPAGNYTGILRIQARAL